MNTGATRLQELVQTLAKEHHLLGQDDRLVIADSLALVEFVVDLEERTDIVIPASEITIDSFASVSSVLRLLSSIS